MFLKKNTLQKNLFCILFAFFFWPWIFETGRDYHGHHGWLPKPLTVRGPVCIIISLLFAYLCTADLKLARS